MRRFLTIAALSFMAVGASPVCARGELPSAVSRQLDQQPADYVRHTREHRMAEIEWRMEREDRWRRRHYRYRDGPRYGGPPPWAPAYGYRREYRDWDD